MDVHDGASEDERATVGLAAKLRDTGDLHPLIGQLRTGDIGPERARDTLRVLAELDVELLVRITLDALIGTSVEDPGLAVQTRRALRADRARRPTADDQGGGRAGAA